MLVIVMHNRKDYLESLLSLARKEGVADATIVEKEDIGLSMIGGIGSLYFHQGVLSGEYDRALVAVVRGEEKARALLSRMEDDATLRLLNLEDRGFVCTVPFQRIKHLELESSHIGGGEPKMKICDYLKEDRMLLSLKARGKKEAITEVSAVLKGAEEIMDFEAFLENVFEREELSTTGIGSGIAIPHARTDAVKDFIIGFGRSADGVEFNSLDDKPVRLIFLMGTPKERRLQDYLRILARLTRLLQSDPFREKLLKASSPKEIIGVFKEAV